MMSEALPTRSPGGTVNSWDEIMMNFNAASVTPSSSSVTAKEMIEQLQTALIVEKTRVASLEDQLQHSTEALEATSEKLEEAEGIVNEMQMRMEDIKAQHHIEIETLARRHAEACSMLEDPRSPSLENQSNIEARIRLEAEEQLQRERTKNRLLLGKLKAELVVTDKLVRDKDASLLQLNSDLLVSNTPYRS